MRANAFGDLWFLDHVTIIVDDVKFLVLIVVDASSDLVWAGPQVSGTISAAAEQFERCCNDFIMRPKCIVADSIFMSENWKRYRRGKGIKWIDLGDHTPWPNRAEAAVKVYKHHTQVLLASVITQAFAHQFLAKVTIGSILSNAAWARSTAVTYGGKTPLEIAFGRRPPDIIQLENMTPSQLAVEDDLDVTKTNDWLRKEALKAHLEVRQRLDCCRDLTQRLTNSS